MARVALVTPTFVEADAVSNDVLGMHAALTARGHDVRVYAEIAAVARLPAEPMSRLTRWLRDPSAVVVYHHATGWRGLAALLSAARCRRVLKYHNVTPPQFFAGVNHDYVISCREGRGQLADLAAARLDLYLADSDYNRRELLDAGADECRSAVVAPFHQVDRLAALPTDAALAARLRDGFINILVVGRLAPNKGHLTLLDAFAQFRRLHDAPARLVVVGRADPRLAVYTEVLHTRVAALGLGGCVLFAGAASDAELKAYYETADVFVIASAHEGFCVPLVEAMALGVPVVALGSTAVPETLGDAGVAWDEADADLLAESMLRVTADPRVRDALAARGRSRYAERFTNARIERDLIAALAPVFSPPVAG